MKVMKKILTVLMVLSMVVVFAAPASAAYRYLECQVMWAGFNVATGDVEVKLLPTIKTKKKTFVVSAAATDVVQNRILSIALTALSNGWNVSANIDYNDANSEILDMRLIPPAP